MKVPPLVTNCSSSLLAKYAPPPPVVLHLLSTPGPSKINIAGIFSPSVKKIPEPIPKLIQIEFYKKITNDFYDLFEENGVGGPFKALKSYFRDKNKKPIPNTDIKIRKKKT